MVDEPSIQIGADEDKAAVIKKLAAIARLRPDLEAFWLRACPWVLVATGWLLGQVYAQGANAPPPAADLAAALGGGWTRSSACDHPVHFQLRGNTLLVVGTDGKVDTQRVLQRRSTGVATQTTASAHGNPIGLRWVYEVLAPGQLSLTDQTGRSATFQRCRPPIPATASPAEFLRGMFAIYADGADASLPFASEAGLHAFLVPDLADALARDAARVTAGDRIDAAPCLRAEPITGAQDDYAVSDVAVNMPAPVPGASDRTSGTVSFRNGGVPASVRFDLQRTASGWRIDDLHSATTPSLRAQMASCAAAR